MRMRGLAARPLSWKISPAPALQTNLPLNYPGIRPPLYLRGDGKIRCPPLYLGGNGEIRVRGSEQNEEIWGTSIAELWKGNIEDEIDPTWRAWVESSHELWNQKNEEQRRRDLQVRWSILRDYLNESGFETHNHRPILSMKSPEDDHQTIIFTIGSPDLGLQSMHKLVLHRGPFCSFDWPMQAVNGLLCFVTSNMKEFLIYNPMTGEKSPWIETPVSQGEENTRGVDCIELGFDPVTNQHKVICISSSKFKDYYAIDTYGFPVSPDPHVGADDQIVQVLTVGENTWRRIDAVPPYHVCIGRELLARPVYVNGNVYWRFRYIRLGEVIMGFDFGSEKFRVIPIPDFCIQDDPEDDVKYQQPVELMEIDGRLALIDGIVSYEKCVWVMHEDSGGNIEWKNEDIYIPYSWNKRLYPCIIALTGTNLICIRPDRPDSIFYYNRNTKEYLRFPLSPDCGLSTCERIMQL